MEKEKKKKTYLGLQWVARFIAKQNWHDLVPSRSFSFVPFAVHHNPSSRKKSNYRNRAFLFVDRFIDDRFGDVSRAQSVTVCLVSLRTRPIVHCPNINYAFIWRISRQMRSITIHTEAQRNSEHKKSFFTISSDSASLMDGDATDLERNETNDSNDRRHTICLFASEEKYKISLSRNGPLRLPHLLVFCAIFLDSFWFALLCGWHGDSSWPQIWCDVYVRCRICGQQSATCLM